MKWVKVKIVGVIPEYIYRARSKNFIRKVLRDRNGGWYVLCEHAKLDIRYNSLWVPNAGLFNTIEEAKAFAEAWTPDAEGVKCLGDDVCK